MASYKDIQREIDKLQKLAASTRKTEVKSVIAGIRKQIAEHGLTAEELGFAQDSVPKTRAGAKSALTQSKAPAGIPKYQDPKSKRTWTGRGKPPTWIATVKNRDAFLIHAAPVSPEAGSSAAVKSVNKAAKPGKPAKVPSLAPQVQAATKSSKVKTAARKSAKPSAPVETPMA